MKTETSNTAVNLVEIAFEAAPFVNEECGDTMWNDVLEAIERKTETL